MERIAQALERMAPAPMAAPDFDGAEAFVWHVAPDRLEPVAEVNRIDLALRATPGGLPNMNYRASTLCDFTLRLYAAPAYLSQQTAPHAPQQLAEHDLVASRDLIGMTALQLNDQRGRSTEVLLQPKLKTSDYASAQRLVLAGAGIGALPDLVAARSVASGALTPVLPDWHLSRGTLYAISLGGAEAPARVRVFREYLRAELAQLQG